MHSANERQVGGTHYAGGIQHWDFTLHVLRNRYLEGCITKYITRFRKKNGLQDLQKAQHYLQKLQEAYAQDMVMPLFTGMRYDEQVSTFVQSNDIIAYDLVGGRTLVHQIVNLITHWSNGDDLETAASLIETAAKLYGEELAATINEATSAYVAQDEQPKFDELELFVLWMTTHPQVLLFGGAIETPVQLDILAQYRKQLAAKAQPPRAQYSKKCRWDGMANGKTSEALSAYAAQGEGPEPVLMNASQIVDIHFDKMGGVSSLRVAGCTTVEEAMQLSQHFFEKMRSNLNGS